MSGKISFEVDKCKGCYLCIHSCPINIISVCKEIINKKGYNPVEISKEKDGKCIACGNCAIICPDSIITVEKE